MAPLSNSWGNTYPREQINAVFDPVVTSRECGMHKPNPDIFQHTLDLLGIPTDGAASDDDVEPNTHGAAVLGLQARAHHSSRARPLVTALRVRTSTKENR